MKKYPSYKVSGVEWIGEIPSHWERTTLRMLRNSNICEFQDGNHGSVHPKSDDFVESGVPFLRPTDVFQNYISKKNLKYIPESFLDKLRIGFTKKGDLIFVNRGNIGVTCLLKEFDENQTVIINPQLTYIRCDENEFITEFLHYQSQSNLFQVNRDLKLGNGSVLNFLGLGDLGDYKLLFPPLSEQHQIVSYLDEKTSQIDTLIQTKKRKIGLLKEYRTSLINEVVTKGLNPDVEMKDSGVEWIGDIPSHWVLLPLNYVSENNEKTLSTKTVPDYELEYVEISDVSSEGRILNKTPYKFKDSPSRCRRILRKGDVFISTVRTYLKSIGFVEKEVQDLICSTGFCVITPSDKIKTKFLFYVVCSEWFISLVISNSDGVSYPSIQSEKLVSLPIVLPPLEEQEKIIDFIYSETQAIDKTISLEEQKIDLLKEYKQSLISEVVTGKVNVQEETEEVLV